MAKQQSNLKTDEKGNVVVQLPICKIDLTFRRPKGRDLKALEVYSQKDRTAMGILFYLASSLSVTPLTPEDLENMDAEDVKEVERALASFPVFANLGG